MVVRETLFAQDVLRNVKQEYSTHCADRRSLPLFLINTKTNYDFFRFVGFSAQVRVILQRTVQYIPKTEEISYGVFARKITKNANVQDYITYCKKISI
jgi:hypothetical protein